MFSRSSLSAAARASSVIVAPASMRAISSCRAGLSISAMPVATRSVLPDFEIRKCVAARAATCGAWVTDSTCTRFDRRASLWPMASATAPPTPVSISSKTSVGAEPRSASATFSAKRKRDSSPPDATFIIGPGRVPGLVRTQNSIWSMPSSMRVSASLFISTMKAARSSFSAGNSAMTALVRPTAAAWRSEESCAAAMS
ncbi:mlr1540 [Mesorhizobium japonicum MAFF 303099]|uniref:Mlr1540 protein n=1 Tax=Mesorhizobium japonicum (strain LMG 29417 / CECT 9101 / MAFF 303099) TaxID=266835 RepID=Q98KC2_RHILO|nr:mlr1540 [Mesorhizobium japonicum MAFF 303099]